MLRSFWATLFGLLLLIALAGLTACGSSKPPLPNLPPLANSSDVRQTWQVSIGKSAVGFAPVIQGDSVFAAAADGTVMRVALDTGRVVWKQSIGVSLVAGVGADADIVSVVDRQGMLHALTANGQKKWSIALGSEAASLPVVGLGLVIIRTVDNRIHAYDTESGRAKWISQRPAASLSLRQTSGLAVTAGTVYVGLPGARLAALSLSDGAVRWEQLLSVSRGTNDIERLSDVVGTPLVFGRDICAVTYQGRLACFEAASGNPQWSSEFSSNSGLDIDSRILVATNANGTVQAFRRDGKAAWTNTTLQKRTLSTPSILGDVSAVGDQQGFLHFIGNDDGAMQGRISTDGSRLIAPIAVARKLAVVQTSGGSLIGLAW